MFGSLIGAVSDFVDDPIGTTVKVATQPVRDGISIIGGLTEGELRAKAAIRLGADVVGGWHSRS